MSESVSNTLSLFIFNNVVACVVGRRFSFFVLVVSFVKLTEIRNEGM
jgi:hypothetical protein